MVFLTGRIHIQIQDIAGNHKAGLSHFSIPKHEWTRVIVQFQMQTVRLYFHFIHRFSLGDSSVYINSIHGIGRCMFFFFLKYVCRIMNSL
jgi:hypothetical protein